MSSCEPRGTPPSTSSGLGQGPERPTEVLLILYLQAPSLPWGAALKERPFDSETSRFGRACITLQKG